MKETAARLPADDRALLQCQLAIMTTHDSTVNKEHFRLVTETALCLFDSVVRAQALGAFNEGFARITVLHENSMREAMTALSKKVESYRHKLNELIGMVNDTKGPRSVN